jgi:hypothetical protein
MAEKIKITLEVDESGSIKVVDQLGDKLDDVKKAGEKAADGIESTTKAAKKGESTFSKLGSAIKGAFAIGGVMKILDTLASLFMENQKVVNLLNQAMVVLQGVMNGVIEVLNPLFSALMRAFTSPKQAWDNLMESFQQGANWIKTNLIDFVFNKFIEWANDAQIAVLKLQKTWNEWTKDTEKAVEIQKEINALEKENGELQNENAKKIGNIKKVANDVKDFYVGVATTIAKSTKKAFDNKEVLANAEHNIERLGILFQGIVEKYDLMAEQQRQIRDDETKTISERIAANNELAKVLDEGAKKEKENLQARIGLLQTQQNLLGATKERSNEILSLQQELTAVDAKYAGLKSEQLTNINALEKEGIELKKAEAEGTIEANAIISQSNADLLADTLEGFDARQKALDDEFAQRSELLNTELSQLKEGTQAYVDAVNEKKILEAQFTADSKALASERVRFIGENAEAELEIEKELQQGKVDAVMGAMAGLQTLLGEDSKYGKALAVAQAIISTYQGASKALGQGGVFGPVAAAGVIAQGLAQVRSIMATELPDSPMGSDGGGSAMSMPSGPSVGIIQGQMSQTSQLQAELNSQMRRPYKGVCRWAECNNPTITRPPHFRKCNIVKIKR